MICSVVQTNENYLELSLGCMANAVAVPSPSLQFSYMSNGPIAGWGTAILKNDTFLQHTWSIAGRNQSDNNAW